MANEDEIMQYVQSKKQSGGPVESQSKWQVDPKDIRVWVEQSLKGQREQTVEKHKYQIINKENNQILKTFFAKTKYKAKTYMQELQNKLPELRPTDERTPVLIKTNQKKYQTEVEQVEKPLVNDTGAYHILSIMEGVFSRIGTMSKLTMNEIKDITYQDVFIPLIQTIMQNHETYGIDEGSRDEIVGFVVSTSMLILKSSHGGWARKKLSELTQERVITQRNNDDKSGGNFPIGK